jgi:hypothetical protein
LYGRYLVVTKIHAKEETNPPGYTVKRLAWEYCGSEGSRNCGERQEI